MVAAKYQQVRLWSGITSITLNLALVWAAAFLAPAMDDLFLEWPIFILLPGVLIGAQLLLFPLDFLTGHVVETAAGRSEQTSKAWIRDWLHGVIRYTAALTAAGLIFAMQPLRTPIIQTVLLLLLGTIMVATALCLLGILPMHQVLRRSPDSRFSAAVQQELQSLGMPSVMLVWIDDAEPRGVNGSSVDFVKSHTVLLSASLPKLLTPRQTALLVAREIHYVHRGYRWQSLLICVAWLLIGVGIGWNLPAAEGLQSALIPMAFVSTWCLAGLFIWPSLSRKWMLAADRWLASKSSPHEVRTVLQRVQELNATDETLGTWTRRIFHPIPPVNDRTHSLQ